MNDTTAAGPPPGPKTALRTGPVHAPFGPILAACQPTLLRDPGAVVRRALAEEIRAQDARPAGKKRRR